ncbi:NUDIX hydrolase [Rubellimicrobium aerolatum]|uniref:NUDIX hydrolase n=1 Tax=Rubellimicrobium aerolatum TaxID=490979 RepID=A0ABW0SF89_9RHOB|nr:NUDIX hydrolase [Rubellimicrobium aerolatum]MBP1805656.1 8-oxo-dGTP pyrophosphatase MutT (NUDIX family) [Rubellimicrobium aerolatum]
MTIQPLAFLPSHLPRRHTEPRFSQLAALCWRKGKAGAEVLLVTSSSGRWILPKGWPMAGKTPAQAALTEAWEEAGVSRGKAGRKPVGQYVAIKRTAEGDDLPCLHHVYAIKVRETQDDYPEAHRRDRLWVASEDAARLVDEEGLREILRNFRPLG